jgi:prepilin-type N-terminal cleavage/methylation domain-containing protein
VTVLARPLDRAGRLGDQDGFGIIEVLIAIVILSVAIAALVSVFTASALSLHRSDTDGTAVTLAEDQMEIYRTVPFSGIRIDGTAIPTSGLYVTGHSTNSNIPPSTGQAVAGQYGDSACPDSNFPAACDPVQSVTGPDGKTYTIDTYVDFVNDDSTLSIAIPASGLTLKRVTVVVRDGVTNAVLANDSSAFGSS